MLPWETPISCLYVSDREELGNTHLLLVCIRQKGISYHLEQSMGQKLINEGRQMAMKIKVVKIR